MTSSARASIGLSSLDASATKESAFRSVRLTSLLRSLSQLAAAVAVAMPLLGSSEADAGGPAARTGAQSQATHSSPGQGTLCHVDEAVVFGCVIAHSGKRVSICSSRALDGKQGYLQYRFGRPGNVELEFPKDRRGSQSAFRYTRYTRPRVTYLRLEFRTGGYLYSLSEDYNAEENPPSTSAAVTVTPLEGPEPERRSVELECRVPFAGSLMSLEDVVPRGDEDASE
jgi:hypothetical protein